MIGFLSVFLVGERVVEPSILYTMHNIYKCTTILLLRDRVLFYVVNDYSACNKMIMYLMFQYDFFYLLEWVRCISLLRKITMQCHLYLQNNWTVIWCHQLNSWVADRDGEMLFQTLLWHLWRHNSIREPPHQCSANCWRETSADPAHSQKGWHHFRYIHVQKSR